MGRRKGKKSASSSSTSAFGSTSQASNATAREAINLPPHQVVSTTLADVLNALEAMKGSRAAFEWVPSFRLPSDWDLVATPQQAIDIIRQQDAEHSGLLRIKLIKQPLVKTLVKRRPMPADIQGRINALPSHLYKISGKAKDSIQFEIEVIDYQDPNHVHSSALTLLNLCNNAPPDDLAYVSFSFGTGQRNRAIAAPLELLEALKTSHIYWPNHFEKHIADLHTFRAFLAPNSSSTTATVNLGHHADKGKPLTPPARSPQLEEFLATQTLEIEAFRGSPGAHINSNVSDEDFFGHGNDLLVARRIPHTEIHTMVMYGDEPVYESLKAGRARTTLLSRALFEQAPYEIQLHCIKEEVMAISLGRFLLPQLTDDEESAYRSALIHVCITLTKGWFRQFVVDNFPRLVVCDKALLPIRDAILEKHPAPQQARANPLESLKKSITNLEDLCIIQELISLGKRATLEEIRPLLRRATRATGTASTATPQQTNTPPRRRRAGRGYNRRHSHNEVTSYWTISSKANGLPALVISFTDSERWDAEPYEGEVYTYDGTLAVLPLIPGVTLAMIKNPPEAYQKAVAHAINEVAGSWNEVDVYGYATFSARSLTNEVTLLDVDGLTEELLMAYIVDLVQPMLSYNGEARLEERIRNRKVTGDIPKASQNHTWFDLWKYHKKT
ncbi:hypothetical protein MBANPS3_001985 [Mucor bainieri]